MTPHYGWATGLMVVAIVLWFKALLMMRERNDVPRPDRSTASYPMVAGWLIALATVIGLAAFGLAVAPFVHRILG